MKLSKNKIFIVLLIISSLVIFRPFFFKGLYPIPYNNLVLLHFPYSAGGWNQPDHYSYRGGFFASDVYRQLIPWKKLALEQLKKGQLPLWNPYNFSGEPLAGNIQTTLLYPLGVIFFFLKFDVAWSLYIISTPIIAAIGMYLLLKEINLSFEARVIVSFAWAYSMRAISWMQWGVVIHSGVWLPLLIVSFLWMTKGKKWASGVFVFALVSTILAGYPQESSYALLLFSSFVVFKLYPLKVVDVKSIKRFILPLVVVGFFVLAQVIPTALFYNQSTLKALGKEGNYFKTQMHPFHLMTFFAPDYFGNRVKENYWAEKFTTVDYLDPNFYIGGVALIFVIYELIWLTRKTLSKQLNLAYTEKFAIFWTILGLLLITQGPVSDIFGMTGIPVLTSGAAVGASYIVIFGLSLLAGFGFKHWKKDRNLLMSLSVGGSFVFVGMSLLFVPEDVRKVALRNLVISQTIALLTWIFLVIGSRKIFRKYISIGVLLLLSVSLFEYARITSTIISYASDKIAFPEHFAIDELRERAGYNRIAGFWDSEITTNLHTEFRLYSVEGYNPLNLYAYNQVVAAAKYNGYPEKIGRSDADIVMDNSIGRNRLLELTSVKYIISKLSDPKSKWEEEVLKYDPKIFHLVWQKGNFKIYEYLLSLDRVKLYSDYLEITSSEKQLDTLYSQSFDPQNQVILEENIGELADEATGSAQIISYEPNHVTIESTIQKGPMLLLLTDSYYPSWQAQIDGQPTPIYKANHAFRAIKVPEGEHTIEFRITWP